MSAEEKGRLSALFHAYDADNSGCIEKNEFFTICQELHVAPREAEGIFKRLDVDNDGTVTLEEFISGFAGQELDNGDGDDSEEEKNEEGFSDGIEVITTR